MRRIVQTGDPVLRRVAKEIPLKDIGSSRVRGIIADMKALLAKEEFGVAIAAPQVGESLRMFVVASKVLIKRKREMGVGPHRKAGLGEGEGGWVAENRSSDLSVTKKKPEGEKEMDEKYLEGLSPTEDEVYINPVMIKMSRGKKNKHEGCLSVRGKWGEVPRAEKATVQAYNEKGEKFERGASGFLAHVFQHEMDHLDGILYTDKAAHLYDDQKTEKT